MHSFGTHLNLGGDLQFDHRGITVVGIVHVKEQTVSMSVTIQRQCVIYISAFHCNTPSTLGYLCVCSIIAHQHKFPFLVMES